MSTKNKWIFAGAVILGLWFLIGIAPYCLESNSILVADPPSKTEQALWAIRGQMGDMFGAVNSLFSALALAGLIYTVFLQRKELQLQRRDLALTRREVKRSASAQEKSEKALRKQAASLETAAKLSAIDTLLRNIESDREGTTAAIEHLELDFKKAILIRELEDIFYDRDADQSPLNIENGD